MCGQNDKCCCQQPENLKSKPADCTPQQVQKCHGEVKHHPCCADDTKEEDDTARKADEPKEES